MRYAWLLGLVGWIGCAPSPIATAVVGLGAVPEGVEDVVISVLDPQENEVVASATVTAPLAAVELGVPAERPLVFRAVARTNRPGPRLVGGFMPSYVARAERTIPLGSEQVQVDLLARPAGVLTTIVRSEDGGAELFFEDEAEARRPVRVFLEGQSFAERSVVLPAGRYRAVADEHVVVGGEGLFVAREQESIAVLDVERARDAEDVASVLRVRLDDGAGAPCELCVDVMTATATPTALDLHLDVLAADLSPLQLDDVRLQIVVEASPPSLVVTSADSAIRALPAVVRGLTVQGRGRLRVRVVATTDEDRVEGALAANALYPDDVLGVPVRIDVSVDDDSAEALARGTALRLALLDASDRYARSVPGRVDLTGTSPYIFLPDGRTFDLVGDEAGRVERRLARPSAPRGVSVSAVMTVTSTAIAGTWTATVTLPQLELPSEDEG